MNNRLTIKEILERTIGHFEKYGVMNPRLDAEVLLADLLGLQRIQLYVRFDQPLTTQEVDQYRERVVLRSKRVPVAYIIGHQEFMSLPFIVRKDVLIPRPETEHLVETTMEYIKTQGWDSPLIVDVGTGSGAIAVSLAHYLPAARVAAVDVSSEALAVAKENSEHHLVAERISLYKGSFLQPIITADLTPDVVVSNPPYIPSGTMKELQAEVQYEPKLALDGGKDGLDPYRTITAQARQILRSGGVLAFEVGIGQAQSVAVMMEGNFTAISIIPDLAGIDRVVMGVKK